MDSARLVQHESCNEIVKPTSRAAERGMLTELITSVDDVEIVPPGMFEHAPSLIRRVLAVVVKDGNKSAARLPQPGQDSRMLTVVTGKMHVADSLRELLHQLKTGVFRRVGRSIVDQDDFEIDALKVDVELLDE